MLVYIFLLHSKSIKEHKNTTSWFRLLTVSTTDGSNLDIIVFPLNKKFELLYLDRCDFCFELYNVDVKCFTHCFAIKQKKRNN